MFDNIRWKGWVLAMLLTSAGANVCRGDDFRIETKVALKGKVVTENLTLFYGVRVYDFMGESSDITVFDPTRSRFLLLDPNRKIRTEVKVSDVVAFMQRLRSWAREEQDPFMNFLADPKFDQKEDQQNHLITLTSPYMSYKLFSITAPNDEVARQENKFSDWYAQLSTMATVGKMPPFPRMMVNSLLKQHRAIPTEVKLTLHLKEEVSLQSDHKVNWRLLEDDLQMIRRVDGYMAQFKAVPFEEYLRVEEPTTTSQR